MPNPYFSGPKHATFDGADSTSARWPLGDGVGGVTATDTDSDTADSTRVLVEGVVIQSVHTSLITVEIMKHDGSTTVIALALDPGVITPKEVRFGREGIEMDGGFSAKAVNANCKFDVIYRSGLAR